MLQACNLTIFKANIWKIAAVVHKASRKRAAASIECNILTPAAPWKQKQKKSTLNRASALIKYSAKFYCLC